jgi:A-macroglobulin TED domain/Alpha-2-macroglobulin family/MG2 domain/Carboxypeptidase regulatory-like domain/A-macroglobulin receptor binding domain/Macroglobulin domain MG3
MSRRWLLSLVCVGCALSFFSHVTTARFGISVDEAATEVFLKELAPEVSLVVENGSKQSVPTALRLELITPAGRVVATSERKMNLKAGRQTISVTLPFKTHDLTPDEDSEILWYRLHYRITSDTGSETDAEGLISLSEITPDLFDLQIIGPRNAIPGKDYSVGVRAAHPLTRRPLKDVDVKGLITASDSDEQDISLINSALTDSNGYAELQFKLPPNLDEDDIDLEVEGRLGVITVKADKEINVDTDITMLVSTDKPLYQPGQTVHARLLMLGPSRKALAEKNIEVAITDPEDNEVFSSSTKTSRFGIASAEWTIPDRTRLGDYSIEFKDSDDDDHSTHAVVKISRYDLPTFAVNAKTDRPYYLKGEAANVEIKADYLFGQPVKRGHVRLVRETERTWNYREQKYDIEEGDKYEGDTLPNGTFKAQINLSEDYQKLVTNDYSRFTDLPYTAYFTDPTTNRTEQQRFNIRLTKGAIHIYVIRPRDSYYQNRRLPVEFFVSTFYADGAPAICGVTINISDSEGHETQTLRQIRTNRYGIATVNQIQIPQAALAGNTLHLEIKAQDKDAKTGTHTEGLPLSDEPEVRVATKKSVLAKGEPVETTITSSEPNLELNVSVGRNGTVINSQPLKLHNGRASLLLPYRAEYKDELTISAYAESDSENQDFLWGAHTVLYPRKRDLSVNLETPVQTYKPGEQAHVKFRAVNPEGLPVESALAVVVTDKAVDERVRTDQEYSYGGFYGAIKSFLGSGDSIGEITRKSLEQIDVTKPVPSDLALVAEALLNQGHSFDSLVFHTEDYDLSQASVFSPLITKQLDPVNTALKNIYKTSRVYPRSEATLRQLLSTTGIDFQMLRDPWGLPYRTQFWIEQTQDVFTLTCAGADKRFDTADDFNVTRLSWPYFQPTGELVDATVQEYHRRTGGYIRSLETLRAELRAKNFDLDTLRDPWGRPYQIHFNVNGSNYQIQFSTVQRGNGQTNDIGFTVWQSSIDYFSETRFNIDAILARQAKDTTSFPGNASELHDVLLRYSIDTNNLRDPWNRPYYFVFQSTAFYGNQVSVETRSVYNQVGGEELQIKPSTRRVGVIRIKSAGADAREGTQDDFEVGFFSATVSEQTADDTKPKPVRTMVTFSGSTGAINGTVVDLMDAVIPNATVTAKSQNSDQVFEAKTDDNGKFLIRNLPAGVYEVRASGPGFKDVVVTHVVVRSSELIQLNLRLEVGAVQETVSITAANVETLQISDATAVTKSATKLILLAPGLTAAKQQLATPRVREYFPETLLWQPQLTTDKKGRAQLDFKLADNITTWRMSVIGSTEDGEIGIADTEIRAFQPFFAELDPPRILTQGDRISLPVVLRNYLDKKQSVDLSLKRENWFKILDTAQKRFEVAAGDSQNQVFNLQTVASITDGKQRVTALGSDFSDAIEKPVTVHPDGEEKTETTSDLLADKTTLNVTLPADTIANSADVELKVYPNLMTHVWESVEAIMKRPYGCGEQTVSSTYPSLLVLRYLNQEKLDSPIALRAKKYLEEGYQRLLGYQSSNGGFTYWGHGDPDVALTAYAIRFLQDASEVTRVDANVLQNARRWLIEQQRTDGSWPAYYWDKKEDLTRTAMLTALVARTLAAPSPTQPVSTTTSPKINKTALVKALNYLDAQVNGFVEPYLLASYSLAASLAGDTGRADKANATLKSLAHAEGQGTYWALETNTPFYGWGLAGRVETTALAIQALARQIQPVDQEKRNLQTRGLVFLLRNKDRYGVWYSTQATINVLDAMLSLMTDKTQTSAGAIDAIEVVVNGQPAQTVSLPADTRMTAPSIVKLSSMLTTGTNLVEFRRTGSRSPVSVQIVNNYYVPWRTNEDLKRVRSGDAESLLFETRFDKHESRITDEITCHVKAERIGFHGYGMLLAEIGLPPGVDVDRASLETAMRGSNRAITQYDVLPDRVVVYLWPSAGGTDFSFKFRPRMAMTAKAAASSIYDYYNPEAKAVVSPGTFVVSP